MKKKKVSTFRFTQDPSNNAKLLVGIYLGLLQELCSFSQAAIIITITIYNYCYLLLNTIIRL